MVSISLCTAKSFNKAYFPAASRRRVLLPPKLGAPLGAFFLLSPRLPETH